MVDHNVLVTARSFGTGSVDVVRLLESTGCEVVRASSLHDPAELIPLLPRADAWITGGSRITGEFLDIGAGLRVVAHLGPEPDGTDLRAAAQREIVVTCTPGAETDAVADHAVGLLLAALRGTVDGDRRVRAGRWTTTRGRELRTMAVGIVGFGDIGRQVAHRLLAFGATVLTHQAFLRAGTGPPGWRDDGRVRVLPHTRLAAECDAVILLAGGDLPLVDADWLVGSREGQLVVNAGPAELVDEFAVAKALRSGRLSAFAADSLLPRRKAEGLGPLLEPDLSPSVIVTPRLGAQTLEAIDRMGMTVANDVLAVLAGREPQHPVPEFEIQLRATEAPVHE